MDSPTHAVPRDPHHTPEMAAEFAGAVARLLLEGRIRRATAVLWAARIDEDGHLAAADIIRVALHAHDQRALERVLPGGAA